MTNLNEDVAQNLMGANYKTQEWYSSDGTTASVYVEDGVDVSQDQLMGAFRNSAELNIMSDWIRNVSSTANRTNGRPGGILERDKYVTPVRIFDQMKVAKEAVKSDDVISNVVETTEALVFNKIRIECGDEDEENIWAQIIEQMELKDRMTEMWRDLFVFSQFYVASLWANESFKVEGKKTSRTRRKNYNLTIPTNLSIIDPLKVVPVGDFLFAEDQLAYIANRAESTLIDEVIAGDNTTDQVVSNLLLGKMELDRSDKRSLKDVTGASNLDNLYLLDPARVWRHTMTRPSYERFADIRMKSVFELLDMKHQLREKDRVALLGSTNFIVLVKKGTDEHPAVGAEMQALANNMQSVAKTPLIVSDHRLDIEIITPADDNTLDPKRYNNLDSRITARMYQMLHIGGFSAGASGDDSLKLMRVVARGLEARRQGLKRKIEREILHPVWKMNDSLKNKPFLEFYPRQVAIDFDPNFLNIMMELYTDGSVSRETILGIVDIDQDVEFKRRVAEAKEYDKVFESREATQERQGIIGGGNRNGGGRNNQSETPNPVGRRPASDIPDE
jgi:hypothetical protein